MTAKKYIAYGSNMNIEQMERRCPGARVAGKGWLKDHRLFFAGRSEAAVASIEPAEGHAVPVVLWEITPKDEQALEAYRQLGVHVAAAIKIVVLTVDPEMIVFGGSVTAAHELFEESMYEDLKDFAYPNSIKNLKIRFSKLENPGLFGAASLCY